MANKMPTFGQRWSPALSLLINPKDPRETVDLPKGDNPYHALGALMPKQETIDDNDWADLVTGQPHSSQMAGEGSASSGSKVSDADWGDLVTGKPAPPKSVEAPESPPEPDISGGFGLIAKGFQKAPVATAAISAPLALGAAIPIAGVGAMGAAALPWWAQAIGAYYGLPYVARKIGEFVGAPQTGETVGSLMDLVSKAGHTIAP